MSYVHACIAVQFMSFGGLIELMARREDKFSVAVS